jgi:hypothetical protein
MLGVDTSSLTNSSVSDLEKTLPKKPFRINSKVSVGLSTEDKKQTKSVQPQLKGQTQSIQTTTNLTQTLAPRVKLKDLNSDNNEDIEFGAFAGTMIQNRVKEDRLQYEEFLERLGLMKYYDKLWDIGVDSLEGLSKVTVEDYNHLFIPAGIQIKIQRELRFAGVGQESQTKDAGIGTDDTLKTSANIDSNSPKRAPKKTTQLNFGIKMKAESTPAKVQVCTMAIETDPIDEGDIPLNVNEDYHEKNTSTESRQATIHDLVKRTKEIQTQVDENNSLPNKPKIPVQVEEVKTNPFSFTGIGGSEWSNNFAEILYSNDKNENQSSINSRQFESTFHPMKPRELKVTNRVACYGCFKQIEPAESFHHKNLTNKVDPINKVFCSSRCMEAEVERVLAACEVCFKLFEKPKGIPAHGGMKWVCSENCRAKTAPEITENEMLKDQIMKKMRKEEELIYQKQRQEQMKEIDLDFEYNYN